MNKVTIIGGGLAGLISAISLQKADIETLLIEKKSYPSHRVCGEYVSNEVVDYLKSLNIYPKELSLPRYDFLQLTAVHGKSALLKLDLGGFGISRYFFDHFLYEHARKTGVQFVLNTQVSGIRYLHDHFEIKTGDGNITHSEVVIGAFGKRTALDRTLKRSFFFKRSPYMGVKYHIRFDGHPENTVALHNFRGGYCGINKVENNIHNLCYLSERKNLKIYGDIKSMEQEILFRNPYLKTVFQHADFLFDRPEVINEISFDTKSPVEDHILMCGDAAGMITPLCGNGMAMAIHSAKIVSEQVLKYFNNNQDRVALERNYAKIWKDQFQSRLWAGRQIQKLFGAEYLSNIAVNLANNTKSVANFLVKQTHGEPF